MWNRRNLPNLVSGARIALVPAILGTALAGSKQWFVVMVIISLATDVLDGFLARRLHAYSDLGRKLDSAADYLTMITGLAGIALLWPEIVRRELTWVLAGLGAFFAVIVYGFARLGRAPCYHTWLSKIGAAGIALSLVPLLSGWSAAPFHLMIVIEVIAALEEMTIALLVPSHVGEMASVWHAWKVRQESMALLTPPRHSRTSVKR